MVDLALIFFLNKMAVYVFKIGNFHDMLWWTHNTLFFCAIVAQIQIAEKIYLALVLFWLFNLKAS